MLKNMLKIISNLKCLFVLLTRKSTQFFMKKWVDLSVNKTNKDHVEKK